MTKRGRRPGFTMTQEHRDKIAKSNILSNLLKFAEGDAECISKAQADIGVALLKKVMPDLQSVALSNEDDKPFKTEEVGGAAKLASFLAGVAERSGTDSSPE